MVASGGLTYQAKAVVQSLEQDTQELKAELVLRTEVVATYIVVSTYRSGEIGTLGTSGGPSGG